MPLTQGLLVPIVKGYGKHLKKGALGLLFFIAAGGSFAQNSVSNTIANQAQFESAVQAMFLGDYEYALNVFEDLYLRTDSLRVKLEWARTAFLAKKFNLAKDLFLDVLEEPVPDLVRFNISLYLEEIEKEGNQTDWSLGLTREYNPFGIAESQEVIVFGVPFQYIPPTEPSYLSGVTGRFYHARSIDKGQSIRFIGDIYGAIYEGSRNNKADVNLGVDYIFPSWREARVQAGVDHFFQRSDLVVRQPYIGFQYQKDQLTGLLNHYQINGRRALNKYAEFSQLDGEVNSVSLRGARDFSKTLRIGLTGEVVDTSAESESDHYSAISAGIYFQYFSREISSKVYAAYSYSKRRHDSSDPFFQVKRVDRKEAVSFAIQPYRLQLFGVFPKLEVGFESNNSTIPLYSSDRTTVNLQFQKNY